MLLSLAPLPPLVYADGAIDEAEVLVYWERNNDGTTSTAGGSVGTENLIRANVWNGTGAFVDSLWTNLTITEIEAYMGGSDDNDIRWIRLGIFEWVSNIDANALLGFEQFNVQEDAGYEWEGGALGTPVNVGDSREFFYGVYTDSEDGTFWVDQEGGAHGHNIYDPAWTDPILGEASQLKRTSIRFDFNVFFNTSTDFNQFYGNATHFVARRDINYTFPATTVTDEFIRIIYPAAEELANITRYNGGLWDTALDPGDYSTGTFNATHDQITILEATINLHGGLYRLFTASYTTLLTFDGLFWENGTRARNVTVTVHTPTGSTEVFVNQSTVWGTSEEVIQVTWPIEGGGFRQFYIESVAETLTFFTPVTTYAAYAFHVKDYVGYLGGEDEVFLEALRVINGTEFLIQRGRIQDSVTGVAMTLEQYVIYILQIRVGGDVYRFGYYTTEYDPDFTLRLRGLDFSDRAEASYKYATIEGTRPNATHLRGTYLDSRNKTTSVLFEVLFRNYSLAFDDSSGTSPSVQFNYYGADNETDYVVHMVAVHQEFGTIEEYFPLSGARGPMNPVPVLSGFPIPYVMGTILLLACFGVVSETTAPEGAFLVWIVAVGLTATGFIYIPSETFIYVLALIGLMKMRGSGGVTSE